MTPNRYSSLAIKIPEFGIIIYQPFCFGSQRAPLQNNLKEITFFCNNYLVGPATERKQPYYAGAICLTN